MQMYLQIRTNVKDVRLDGLKLKLTDGRTVCPTWEYSRPSPEQGTHVCITCYDVALNCGEEKAKIPELKNAKLNGFSVTVSDELPIGFRANMEIEMIEVWDNKEVIFLQYGDSEEEDDDNSDKPEAVS